METNRSRMVVVQGGLVGRLAPHYGEQKLAASALIIQGIVGFGTASAWWMLYPLSALSSGSAGFIFPTMGALFANSLAAAEQGKGIGVSTALGSLTSILGPLWAGATYDSLAPGAPFWMGGVLFVLAGMLLARIKVTRHVAPPVTAPSTAE